MSRFAATDPGCMTCTGDRNGRVQTEQSASLEFDPGVEISVNRTPLEYVVRVEGEWGHTADDAYQSLNEAIRKADRPRIVIDLTELRISGVEVAEALERSHAVLVPDHQFLEIRLPPHVRRLLMVVGVIERQQSMGFV